MLTFLPNFSDFLCSKFTGSSRLPLSSSACRPRPSRPIACFLGFSSYFHPLHLSIYSNRCHSWYISHLSEEYTSAYCLLPSVSYIDHSWEVDAERRCSSWMNLVALLGQVGGVAREALTTNFWGFGCPAHCHPSSFPSLAATFLSGILSGILMSVIALFWLLFQSVPSNPASAWSVVQQSAVALRSRLVGYRPSLYE